MTDKKTEEIEKQETRLRMIEVAEDFLARVKNGEILGFAAVGLDSHADTITWCITNEQVPIVAILGAIAVMQNGLYHSQLGTSETIAPGQTIDHAAKQARESHAGKHIGRRQKGGH